jgi:hypothetical protein
MASTTIAAVTGNLPECTAEAVSRPLDEETPMSTATVLVINRDQRRRIDRVRAGRPAQERPEP